MLNANKFFFSQNHFIIRFRVFLQFFTTFFTSETEMSCDEANNEAHFSKDDTVFVFKENYALLLNTETLLYKRVFFIVNFRVFLQFFDIIFFLKKPELSFTVF